MLRTLLLLIALAHPDRASRSSRPACINLNQTQQRRSVPIDDQGTVEVGTTTTNVQVPMVKMETRQVEVPSVTRRRRQQANTQ